MSLLNQFSIYSMAHTQERVKDVVDTYLDELNSFKRYEDVKKYLDEKFGDIDHEKLIEYDDINKQIHIVVDDKRIEICAGKNWSQYYGKGWLLISSK